MKVLFAVGNDQWSKTAAERYYEKFGDTLEYENVFYFKALIDKVKQNKTYDRIVIHEDLEQYRAKDIEQVDRKLYDYIDAITDEIQDAEIIYICSDRRTKDDKFVHRLYNLGIYNILIGDDRNMKPLCDIIKKPKTKREAKEYLNITSSGTINETGIMRDDEVDETQMMNILNYYDKIKNEPDKYVSAFDHIASQYSRAQLKVIASWLPKNVQSAIYAEPKYKFLLGIDEQQDNSRNQSNASIPDAKKTERKHSQDFFGVFKKMKKTKNGKEISGSTNEVANATITSQQNQVEKLKREAESEADKQEKLAEQARKEIEARQQQELAERARKEAEARQQQELVEKARREAEERQQQSVNNIENSIDQIDIIIDNEVSNKKENASGDLDAALQSGLNEQLNQKQEINQQELAERARKEAEARQQQELVEQARKEIEARQQQELAEKARKEAEARQQQELAEKARKEAEARQQQELAEQARKETEAKQQQELAEQARKEAEAKQQQELAEQARKEAEAKQQQELAERARKEAEARQQQELIAKAKQEQAEKASNNVISATVVQQQDFSADQRRFKEEQARLAEEQEKIRKAQAELEEEKRKFREEQARIATERNQIVTSQPVQTPTTYESVPVVARDYKKMVVFVGANKAGTSFMTNAIANQLANKKVLTSILDMTKDKGMYYIYNQGDKSLRKIAGECMQRLSEGEDVYLPVSKYMKVYTTIPGSAADARRSYKHKSIIDVVKNNSTATIVDADFTTPIDYFEQAKEIYIIQDMDLLKMQETTSFLREMKNRNMDMNKIKIIINKYVKSMLTPKKIIEGISYYKDPEMTFTDVLLNNKVMYSVVPYNLNNYIKYIESLCKETMSFKGYSTDFLEVIEEISEQVYPTNGLAKKKGGLFR